MSVGPLPTSSPRAAALPPWMEVNDESREMWRHWSAYQFVEAADRNKDGLLGRDEYRGSSFERLDLDRNGLSADELKQGLVGAGDEDLWHLANHAGTADTMRRAHAERRVKSLSVIGVSGAVGAMVTALLGASPFVLVPAALLAGAGIVSAQRQSDKDRWLHEAVGSHLEEAINQRPVALDDFQAMPAGAAFERVCEKVVDVAAAIIHGPAAFLRGLKELVELIVFLFFWCFWPRGAAQQRP